MLTAYLISISRNKRRNSRMSLTIHQAQMQIYFDSLAKHIPTHTPTHTHAHTKMKCVHLTISFMAFTTDECPAGIIKYFQLGQINANIKSTLRKRPQAGKKKKTDTGELDWEIPSPFQFEVNPRCQTLCLFTFTITIIQYYLNREFKTFGVYRHDNSPQKGLHILPLYYTALYTGYKRTQM